MSELSVERKQLQEEFMPATDIDLLKAAEIGGKIAGSSLDPIQE